MKWWIEEGNGEWRLLVEIDGPRPYRRVLTGDADRVLRAVAACSVVLFGRTDGRIDDALDPLQLR